MAPPKSRFFPKKRLGVPAAHRPESAAAIMSSESPQNENCIHNIDNRTASSADASASNGDSNASSQSPPRHCLKQSFAALFNSERLSDVYFIVGQEPRTEKIPAHKLVLSVRSEIFETMFSKDWSSESKGITIPDIEPPVFLAVLGFMYKDFVTINADSVIAILHAAKKYAVHGLEDKCVEFLKERLCPENAFSILKEASLFDEPKLAESCLLAIDKDTKNAVNSDGFTAINLATLSSVLERDSLNIKEVDLFQAVIRWSEAECTRKDLPTSVENKQSVLGGALSLIRFPLMANKDFSEKVARTGLLSDKELVSMFMYFSEKKKSEVNFNTKPRAYFRPPPRFTPKPSLPKMSDLELSDGSIDLPRRRGRGGELPKDGFLDTARGIGRGSVLQGRDSRSHSSFPSARHRNSNNGSFLSDSRETFNYNPVNFNAVSNDEEDGW